jgi:hypothetical protein
VGVVVLLGPRGLDAGAALAELGIRDQVAFVTAGYQSDESNDDAIGAMTAALGVPVTNLRLHARAAEVFAADPEFHAAYQVRQNRYRNLQAFYRIRLEKADEAARMIAVRYVEPELLDQEDAESVEHLRRLDDAHLARCTAVRAAFDAEWPAAERPEIARHRRELSAALASCAALVIAGGHVASLLNRLVLFDVLGLAGDRPVIAWSAGAMALAERIILFHDYPPYGSDIAQVLEPGLGLVPGFVLLPDPRRRVRIDNRPGIARFARRMLPATCLALDHGARVVLAPGAPPRIDAARLEPSGLVTRGWAA